AAQRSPVRAHRDSHPHSLILQPATDNPSRTPPVARPGQPRNALTLARQTAEHASRKAAPTEAGPPVLVGRAWPAADGAVGQHEVSPHRRRAHLSNPPKQGGSEILGAGRPRQRPMETALAGGIRQLRPPTWRYG